MATLGLGVAILVLGSGASCSEERPGPVAPTGPPPIEEGVIQDPALRLLVLTDLDGTLEPCGCTSRPLGGIDRMAARIMRESRGAPALVVAAGNLLFHGAPHGGDLERAATQERLRAETLLTVLERLGLAAAAPGPLDFSFGTDRFLALARSASFPLLAADVSIDMGVEGTESERQQGPPIASSIRRRAGGVHVGIVGLADLAGADGAWPERLRGPEDLMAAARRQVAALREEGADLVIALVSADQRTARRIATGVEGVDFVVHGGTDEETAEPPASTGGAVILRAGRQGQGLLVVDVARREDGVWVDASAWTRRARREHLEAQVTELEARIAAWEADPETSADDVAGQRARLERLRGEIAETATVPDAPGARFSARYEEITPDAPQAARITALMSALDRRVNDANREAFADWTPEPAPDGQPHYVGSATCAGCHGGAVRWWRGHAHGRAYATLEERHKNFNLSCVGCHVTGYLRPGGSTVTHLDGLQDVGCETCHGPASQHVADPSGAAHNVQRDAPESLCVSCHNSEHSDRFHYATYRRLLMAPGHGQPAGAR